MAAGHIDANVKLPRAKSFNQRCELSLARGGPMSFPVEYADTMILSDQGEKFKL